VDIRLNPNNPRFIKDDKFKRLVQSIKDFPKMLELRPIVVDKDGIILGGNMRYRALQELGMEIKDEWVKVADKLTDEEKKRFIVEDNVGFGEWDWDLLSEQYEKEELEEWGMDVDKLGDIDFDNINSTEDREKQFKEQVVTCPHCNKSFEIKI